MKVREFEHGLPLAQNAPDYVRSPGLHMSDIYNSMFKGIDPKRYDKRDEDGNPEELNRAKLEAGMGFEVRLEPLIEAKWGGCRPGELFTQHARDCTGYPLPVRNGDVLCHCGAGIAYSPDWLFTESDPMVLGEFKFSWYSNKEFPEDPKFDKWVCQCQCYLIHLKLTTVWVFPFWVNGSYPRGGKGVWAPPTPDFTRGYELEFTVKELQNNWNAMLRHAWKKELLP
jgi:hypothetical protein